MAEMFIGELAAEFALNPRTLRYYERLGLLPASARTLSGYRVYDEETAQRLAFVMKAKSLGLTLKEIRQLLALRQNGELSCTEVRQLLQAHIARIDHQLTQLQTLKAELIALLDRWHVPGGENGNVMRSAICPRIEAYRPRQRKRRSARKAG